MTIRSLAITVILASTALAQSSSNPYIPSSISAKCSTFLFALNNDAALANCTAPFINTLQAFAPGANTNAGSTSVSSALSNLCGSSTFSGCSDSTVTTQLTAFYAACEAELTTSPNAQVRLNYDVLYTMLPMKQAICSLDDNGKYCAAELSSSSATGASAGSANSKQVVLSSNLYVQVGTTSDNSTAFAPNATTFQSTNIAFLFLQPSMPTSQLCTTCTRNVMTAYISFESNFPFAYGIANSLLLSGQVPLYNNISANCPSNFLGGAVAAAGGLSSGLLSGAAPRAGGQELSAAFGAILGVAAFMAASL